jgi:hypothetical protein
MLLGGCWLRLTYGNVIWVEDIEEEVNEIITTVFSDSTAAVCLATDYGFYECTYIVEGSIFTSTLYLLSELGLPGVLIDPLVIQAPADAQVWEATYNDGNGAKPLPSLQTARFEAQPGLTIQAEPGQQFIILALPAAVEAGLPVGSPANGIPFDLTLRLRRVRPRSEPVTPQALKAMFTARVTLNGHRYYAPILPCLTDFSAIPSVQVPVSATPQNLLPAILNALQATPGSLCDHQAYTYAAVPPPATDWLYLPFMDSD